MFASNLATVITLVIGIAQLVAKRLVIVNLGVQNTGALICQTGETMKSRAEHLRFWHSTNLLWTRVAL
jgi:hypothetical protein